VLAVTPSGGRWIRAIAHVAALLPATLWLWRALADTLGPDPVAELTHASGIWALRFLLACLAMTPLRHAIGAAWPLRFRRMLGLYAFFYASLHLGIYLVLDLGGFWLQILDDLVGRPFIMVGSLAWLLMLPLALTSTRQAMRRLGKRWVALHRLVYPSAILAVLHFFWLVKADLREPLVHAAVLAALFFARWQRQRKTRSA